MPEVTSTRKCNSFKKMSKITCITFTLVILLSVLVLKSISHVIADYYNYDVCGSKSCANISQSIKTSLNYDLDPCNDFNDYVCSKFEQKTEIPEDKVTVTSFSHVDDKLVNQLREVLESKISDNEIEPYKLMKRIYRACNDTDKLNEKGLSPLLNQSPDIKEWPIMHGELEEFDWKDELLKYRHMESFKNWIIGLGMSLDYKNSTKKILEIGEPSLMISREYLVEGFTNKFVDAYYNFMKNLSKIIDNSEDKTEAIREIIEFEIQIAKLTIPREEKRNATQFYNMQTLDDIDKKKYQMFEPIGFFNYVNEYIINRNDKGLLTLPKFDRKEPINNEVPAYLKKIDQLLETTSKRVLKNYLTWKFIVPKLPILTEQIRNIILDYSFHTSGLIKRQPRWKECISFTKNILPHAVNSEYTRRYFDEESKDKVENIVTNIKNEFQKIIRNLDWMDEETKKVALVKLKKMKSVVGYPKELMNDSLIIEEYQDYHENWNDDDLFGSIIKLTLLRNNDEIRKFRESYDKNDWKHLSEVAVVNAFYHPLLNAIILPAGILQGAFFNKDLPVAMNYGGIGSVIGHEITHGFDDQGSQYDEDGNLRNWWTPKTKETFTLKKNKIVDQYSNYTEPLTGKKLNGNNTQGENIADNGGVIESYRALQNSDNRNEHLQDLEFNEKQLFWISYGRVWCSVYKKAALEQRIITGSHSPSRFRINGPLQNNVDFSKDFKCKEGSFMNPKNKNIVWG